MLTDIWCRFFIDGPETRTQEKLETIRTVVMRSEKEDILIFNYWAAKIGVPLIEIAK